MWLWSRIGKTIILSTAAYLVIKHQRQAQQERTRKNLIEEINTDDNTILGEMPYIGYHNSEEVKTLHEKEYQKYLKSKNRGQNLTK